MAPRRLCRRDYFAGRLRLQGGFGGERRRPPREEERGPPQLGAPGRRVGDRWGSGLRGPERRAAVPGRRLAPPLTRRQGGGEASDRCGPCGPEWERRCREEGGTAAILQPREEVGPSGRLARRGQGGGEAPPHGSGDPREEGGSPDGVGPVRPVEGAAMPGRRLAPPHYRTPGRRRGIRSVWTFAVRVGAAVPREEEGHRRIARGSQGGGREPLAKSYLP